jgi:hypothetical protein
LTRRSRNPTGPRAAGSNKATGMACPSEKWY